MRIRYLQVSFQLYSAWEQIASGKTSDQQSMIRAAKSYLIFITPFKMWPHYLSQVGRYLHGIVQYGRKS